MDGNPLGIHYVEALAELTAKQGRLLWRRMGVFKAAAKKAQTSTLTDVKDEGMGAPLACCSL